MFFVATLKMLTTHATDLWRERGGMTIYRNGLQRTATG